MLHLLAVHTFSKDAILLVVVRRENGPRGWAKASGMASRLTSTAFPTPCGCCFPTDFFLQGTARTTQGTLGKCGCRTGP